MALSLRIQWNAPWNMKTPFSRIVAALFAAGLVAAPSVTEAYPVFARKYRASCHTCHERSYPKLNTYGRRYKENGYQLAPGAELEAIDRTTISPGTFGEPLRIPDTAPLSLRFRAHLEGIANPGESGRGPVEVAAPYELALVGGGAIARNVSVAFAYAIAPDAFLHYGYVGLHNIGKEGLLNVRVGRFLLLDYFGSGHRRLTLMGNPTAGPPVGFNPFALDDHVAGIDLWGRPGLGPVFWELAVVNGAGDINLADDLDAFKDLFAHVRVTIAEHYTVGAFGYLGSASLTNEGGGITREWGDRFWRAGGNVSLEFGRALAYAHVIYGRHENPDGLDPAAAQWFVGLRLQGDFSISRRLWGVARYDRIDSSLTALELHRLTLHLGYLLATNARLGAELQQDLNAYRGGFGDGMGSTRLFILADVAF